MDLTGVPPPKRVSTSSWGASIKPPNRRYLPEGLLDFGDDSCTTKSEPLPRPSRCAEGVCLCLGCRSERAKFWRRFVREERVRIYVYVFTNNAHDHELREQTNEPEGRLHEKRDQTSAPRTNKPNTPCLHHVTFRCQISARAGFLSGAGTGLSRSPAPRKRSATTQTTQAALRRGSCCTLCSRLRPQLRRWKAASEAPQRGRGHRWRFCYSQLELAALQEVGGDARKNDILTGRVSPKLALETTKEEGS